jgi:siderophore synthetase component
MRAKTLYTTLSNHLGEVIAHLVARCGVHPQAAWQRVRSVVEVILADLDADPALREDVDADRAVLLGATLPIKAFARMRLDPAGGDQYVQVRNPLHEDAALPSAPSLVPGAERR